MAVSLLATALGGYAAGFVISILNMISRAFGTQWISEDLNEGRLDLFFVVVGGELCCVGVKWRCFQKLLRLLWACFHSYEHASKGCRSDQCCFSRCWNTLFKEIM